MADHDSWMSFDGETDPTEAAEISPYEWLAREFDRLSILRKMWTAHEVAAIIRRHDIERSENEVPSRSVEPVKPDVKGT